jgi:ATP-binding cassette, subfamily B, bacterial PglK
MAQLRIVFDLVQPERWSHAATVVIAMIVASLLQSVGAVSVMPFIGLVADPAIIHHNEWMAWAYSAAGVDSTQQFLIVLGLVALGLIALTNLFAAYSRWLTLRFVWDTHDRLSQRLLGRYLSEPYSFYLDRNSSELSKSLLGEVRTVVDNVLMPWMDILSRGITVVVFALLLVLIDPILALLSAGTLSGAYAVIYFALRNKQRALGLRRERAFGDRFRISGEAFGGIKDVKVSDSEGYFLKRFREASRRYSETTTAHAIASELPRYALETVAFGGVVVAILYLLGTRDSLVDVLPVLALYAVAGYRLIPGLQSIFGSLSHIRFYSPAAATLHADLYCERDATAPTGPHSIDRARVDPSERLRVEREIRINHVTFRYVNSSRAVLEDVNLVIPVRTTVGLVGTTGSGKSTLADLILGLLLPTGGDILIDGVRLAPHTLPAWRCNVGYVSQAVFLSDDTIAQNIAFGIAENLIDTAAVESAARAAHLHDFIQRLPLGYQTIVGERGVRLSGGERQRIAIARALYRNPAVLVLDEATSALDGATEESVMRAIRGLYGQKTIVIIAHRLTTVRDCDVIYLLEDGRLVAEGTFSSLAEGNPKFRAMARGVAASVLTPEQCQ